MHTQHIEQLVLWLAEAGIDYLELSGPGQRLRLTRDGWGGSGSHTAEMLDDTDDSDIRAPDGFVVKAPMAGTLLYSHPLQRAPLAPCGSRICAGQTVALLQIGALLVPVDAPHEAIIARLLVEEGALVGFGTDIIRLDDIGSGT